MHARTFRRSYSGSRRPHALLWELDPARVDASDQAAVRQLLSQRMRRLVNEDFRARGGGRSAPRSARSVESLPIAFTELANEL